MKLLLALLFLPLLVAAQTPAPARPSVDDLVSKLPAEQRSAIIFPGLYIQDESRATHRTAAAALVESMLKAGYSEEDCKAWVESYEKRIAVASGKNSSNPPPSPWQNTNLTAREQSELYRVRTEKSPIMAGENFAGYRLRLRYEDLVEGGYANSDEAKLILQQLSEIAGRRAQADQNWRDDQLEQQTELLKQIRANQ